MDLIVSSIFFYTTEGLGCFEVTEGDLNYDRTTRRGNIPLKEASLYIRGRVDGRSGLEAQQGRALVPSRAFCCCQERERNL